MNYKVIDLSHKISESTPTFYGATGLWGLAPTIIADAETYESTALLRTYGKIKELYRTCFITMSDHGCTHIDVPYHINPLGETIDKVPLDTFCGEALIIDVHHLKPIQYDPFKPSKPTTNPEEARKSPRITGGDFITVDVIEEALKKEGENIRRNDIVLFRTDNSKKWPTWEYCHSITPLTIEALKYVLGKGVRVIGVDQASIDIAPDYLFPHHYMRETTWYHFENMTNLDKVPVTRFKLVCYALKLEGGSGSPCRPLAIVEEG